jgi:hypothetical protein
MELWNDGTTAFNAVESDAAGVYLPEGRHPIIPFFQHSIIPISIVNRDRSEPKFAR